MFSKLDQEDASVLSRLIQHLEDAATTFVGYPCNGRFDYSELFPFLSHTVNNLGDPFVPSNYRINTREIECEVVRFFAELFHAPLQDYWGYVTNGGTEGNMYGLFLARETLPQGMVYYSEDTHYSVAKILRVLNARSIMLRSTNNGEMDYDDLRETLRIYRDIPPIIFANIGTTMKGAVDDLGQINEILKSLAIPRYYIHCDAALSGMILPFAENSRPFDFNCEVDSISVSGHKLIGSPIPCGIVVARKRHVDRIARSIEYVGALDTTISGSRNGITPLFLWYAIKTNGHQGLKNIVNGCLDLAAYSVERFLSANVAAWRNDHSITVVFPKPSDMVLRKWQIAVNGPAAHIVTVPHVTKEQVNQLTQDILDNPKPY